MLLLKNSFIKRLRKSEKGAFHPNLKHGASAPCPLAAAVQYNISYCKVNAVIISIFPPLHHFTAFLYNTKVILQMTLHVMLGSVCFL